MGRTVAAAQEQLRAVDPLLQVDGSWGRRTQAAYDRAPAALRESIARLFSDQGKSAPFDVRPIPVVEAYEIFDDEASRAGFGALLPGLRSFLDREARRVAGGTAFDVNSANGGSKGLMQMQKAAWTDARREDPSIGEYANWSDPRLNIRAGLAYARINERVLRRQGVKVNVDNLYLAHNQGAGYFTRGARTNVGGQSREVQALINRA